MPLSALELDGETDFVGPIEALAAKICELAAAQSPASAESLI
jgi:hypothetical protein